MPESFRYTYVGDLEMVFPTLRRPDGSTLVCAPGEMVDLDAETNHPLLSAAPVPDPDKEN